MGVLGKGSIKSANTLWHSWCIGCSRTADLPRLRELIWGAWAVSEARLVHAYMDTDPWSLCLEVNRGRHEE